jgi:hypothetical protein
MSKPQVLIEASDHFAEQARNLLRAANFEVVRDTQPNRTKRILHQIRSADQEAVKTEPVAVLAEHVQKEANQVLERHQQSMIVFFLPYISDDKFLQLLVHLSTGRRSFPNLELTKDVTSAIERIIQAAKNDEPGRERAQLVLDAVPGINALGNDLRDGFTIKLDAEKVAELFGISVPDIARAADVTPQVLSNDPTSDRAQPVLELFERIARLRAHPQFEKPSDLREWFRRPLPIFANHSAEDLFKVGKLELVATKVDEMLTGDFGG